MRVINRVATLSKPQTRYIPIGLSPSGLQCVCVFPLLGAVAAFPAPRFYYYFLKARADVTVTCPHHAHMLAPPLVPLSSLSLPSLSQPHPPISISHACSCAGLSGACVSLSGTRSISNTKGVGAAYLSADHQEEPR